jgi:5-methylcytosine-specific restriction endonuclease McrA
MIAITVSLATRCRENCRKKGGNVSHKILVLDVQGTPLRWMSRQRAMTRIARGKVAWTAGDSGDTMTGGVSRLTSERSLVELPSIIALKGQPTPHHESRLMPTRRALFARDRHLCAYCAQVFPDDKLTRDHVTPKVQGGTDKWTNLCSACRACNSRKGGRTPEEAGMKLVYVPYRPNRAEEFLLIAMGRHKILADQMDWLLKGVPKHSRLLVQ